MNAPNSSVLIESPVLIDAPVGAGVAHGTLEIPVNACNIIVFAHGQTSSNLSPRNRLVARSLLHRGFAIWLPDLSSGAAEHPVPAAQPDRERLFRTANQLVAIIDWLAVNPATSGLRIGLFGAGTGAAAALIAAARRPATVHAVVCRGGRPDLAGELLAEVQAPTLMLVGSKDEAAIDRNRDAIGKMRCKPMLEVIHGTNHLFAEPGKLDQVASISYLWFHRALARRA